MYDVIIVGCGPIGAFTGTKIASKGYSVAIFEEHNQLGNPMKCAGLVSKRVLQLTNEKYVLNKISGMNIIFRDRVVSLRAEDTKAYVINRIHFDIFLGRVALKAGCELMLSSNVISINYINNGVEILVNEQGILKKYKCKLLIGADGANSIVRRFLGYKVHLIPTVFAECVEKTNQKNIVNIYFGNDIAPEFFAWKLPVSENLVRIGLGATNNAYTYFKKNFSQYNFLNLNSACIPIGVVTNYSKRIMLVGDACAQVKPISGGGLYYGLKSSTVCSNVADAYLKGKSKLDKYAILCRNIYTSEINLDWYLRMFLYTIPEKLVWLFLYLFGNKLIKSLDWDYLATTFLPIKIKKS